MNPIPIGEGVANQQTYTITGRDQHMAVFGSTGVGKSTLLKNMIVSDIWAGNGVTVIDPHGDLVEELMEMIPTRRINDVIYLKPDLSMREIAGVNLFDENELNHDRAVSALISLFKNQWPEFWGPLSEYVLSGLAYLMLSGPDAKSRTILVIHDLLTNKARRKMFALGSRSPETAAFMETLKAIEEEHGGQPYNPVLNKVSLFMRNKVLRLVTGQPKGIPFKKLLDEGKILLANLSIGRLGSEVSQIIGSIVATKIYLAAIARENMPEGERTPHYLYCDEVQNFTRGTPLSEILSQARKYGLRIILATQHLKQLPREAIDAIFTNCGTIGSFRVSNQDAEILVKEFASPMPPSNLLNLSNHELYLKVIQDGAPSGPYLLKTFKPAQTEGAPRETVMRVSLQQFGAVISELNATLNRHFNAAATEGKPAAMQENKKEPRRAFEKKKPKAASPIWDQLLKQEPKPRVEFPESSVPAPETPKPRLVEPIEEL